MGSEQRPVYSEVNVVEIVRMCECNDIREEYYY